MLALQAKEGEVRQQEPLRELRQAGTPTALLVQAEQVGDGEEHLHCFRAPYPGQETATLARGARTEAKPEQRCSRSHKCIWCVILSCVHYPRLLTSPIEPDNSETTRYVGQNSIPALLREQTAVNEPQEVNEIRQDMRSLLGLDNSAPFPLMSSRHLDRLTSDIASELPSDREVMKYVLSHLFFASLRVAC